MKQVNELKQNSEEWHQWRKEGIGASEANIIMGTSKSITPLMLFNQKVHGIEIDTSGAEFIFAKGHRLEAKARPLFELEIGEDFPDTIAVHHEFSFLRASLDGFCKEINACWECKFVGQDDFEIVKNGGILDHYFPQLQHQLMVTGAEKVYLYVITDDKEQIETDFPYKTAFVEVLPDLEYMQDRLVPELMKFWNNVEKKQAPKLSDLDVVNLDDHVELDDMLTRYQLLSEDLKELTGIVDELKKNIFKQCKHTRSTCNGVKITKTKSDDKIVPDYAALIESKHMTPEMVVEQGFSKVTKGRLTKRITFPKKSDQSPSESV